ncbi:MAG: S41 family peptidase [Thermoguttaceae bacterium]
MPNQKLPNRPKLTFPNKSIIVPRNYVVFLISVALVSLVCATQFTFRDRILLTAMRQIEETAFYAPSRDALVEGALAGLFLPLQEELGDHYSTYIPPRECHEQELLFDNKLEGIGVSLTQTKSGKFCVTVPFFGGPAAKAGIVAGDVIVSVNGVPLEGRDIDTVSSLIAGDPKTNVELVVQTRDEPPRTVNIERAVVQLPTVEGYAINDDGTSLFTLPDHPHIGYIAITSFTDETPYDLLNVLEQLPQSVTALILDLRGNPGGSLTGSAAVADLFVAPNSQYKNIVTVNYRAGRVYEKRSFPADDEVAFALPMAVLIDRESASASEIVAAALQDYKRASVVGERSYGKGTVQEAYPLPLDSGMLYLTVAQYLRPSGANINRWANLKPTDVWGVVPDADGIVPQTSQDIWRGARERLLRANLSDPAAAIKALAADTPTPEELAELADRDTPTNTAPENTPYTDRVLERAVEIIGGGR